MKTRFNQETRGCVHVKIMIVEDDEKIRELMKENLQKWSYDVNVVTDFYQVMSDFIENEPHLVLLDVQLPVFDGFHWCQQIRQVSTVPIIIVSKRDNPLDIVMAMNLGADDYIEKPFHIDVLMAKVKSVLRRTYDYTDGEIDLLEWKGMLLDLKKSVLLYDEHEIDLTKNECFILAVLFEAKGAIVTREEMMRQLWEDEQFVSDNTLTVNVTRIRKKLAEVGKEDVIVTKKGLGYMVG